MAEMLVVCALAAVAVAAVGVRGEVFEGRVVTTGAGAVPPAPEVSLDKWVFLARFCFAGGEGQMNFTLKTGSAEQLAVLFYDDEPGSWPSIVGADGKLRKADCEARSRAAKVQRHERFNTTMSQDFSNAGAHYWFVAVACCSCDKGIDVEYALEFVNLNASVDSWAYQLSYDEQPLPQIYISFFVLFSVLVLLPHCVGVVQSLRREEYHPLVRVFSVVLLVEWLGLLAIVIHFGLFKENGRGEPLLYTFGQLCDLVSQTLFMVLLILIAKGWGISKNHVSRKLRLAGGLAVMSLVYLGAWIWQYAAHSPATQVYIYDSVAGWIIALLRVPTVIVFGFYDYQSFRREPDRQKQSFFAVFGAAGSIWLIILPFLVLIASSLPDFIRWRIVESIYISTNCAALAAMTVLLLPPIAARHMRLSERDLHVAPTGRGMQRPAAYDRLS